MTLRLFNFAAFVFVGSVQSFDYKDEMAQGTCTSLVEGADHVYAVRRTCSSTAASCDTVCSDLGKKCFNALHVYQGIVLGSSENEKEGLHTFRYNTCSGTNCGPNFCCCANNEHSTPNPNAFKDKIAQATCTAILPGSANHVYAVRRECRSDSTVDCNAVCDKLGKGCFNALHVYNGVELSVSDVGKEGLHTYRYNKCTLAGCGPNFCCCSG